MLELQNICSGYGKKQVLKDVSVSFRGGEITSIIGPNGCGKSTLIKTIIGVIKPMCGKISVNGQNLLTMRRKEIAKKLSYLAQGKIVPDMTVEEMVLNGRYPHIDYPKGYSEKDKEIAYSAMKKMGIERYREIPIKALSGGMQQNAYIAMALAQDTDFILMDEPTTYLDVANRLQLFEVLKMLAGSGKGIVTVIHDIVLAMEYSDTVTVINDGEVLMSESPETVYESGVIEKVFGVGLERIETEKGFSYYYKKKS